MSVLGVILLGFCFLFLCSNNVGRIIKMFDLFTKDHNHEEFQIMYVRRNVLGGFNSFVFGIVALMILAISFVSYLHDNVDVH